METKSERVARGRPVGWDVPYAAMGGLIGFSSVLEGGLAVEARRSGERHSLSQYVTDRRLTATEELHQSCDAASVRRTGGVCALFCRVTRSNTPRVTGRTILIHMEEGFFRQARGGSKEQHRSAENQRGFCVVEKFVV